MTILPKRPDRLHKQHSRPAHESYCSRCALLGAQTSGPQGLGMDASRYVWAMVALVGFAVMSGWTRMALTQSATVNLISAEDTTLKQGTPNANQGAETLLRIQHSGNQRVLVRFDQQALEQAIGNSSIRSAKLRLFIAANGNNWGTDGREVNVHRLTQAWTEAGATWNCPNDTNTGNGSPDCSPSWEMGGSSLPAVCDRADTRHSSSEQPDRLGGVGSHR